MKCLNHEKEQAWKSPFETYYGRKPNELVNEGKNYEKIIHTAKSVRPSKSDYYKQNRTAENWSKASKADDRVAERMIRSHERKSTCKTYQPGDKVFAKMGEKRGRSIRK